MTKDQIDRILDRVRTWPVERQKDAAQLLLGLEQQNASSDGLDEADCADLQEALAEAEREEPVSEEEIQALFDRYRHP
ncbi:MAG TPA: hypothetical protein VH743_19385 [Beijerinckiaceae bacterium]|jgi:hypothetical protein